MHLPDMLEAAKVFAIKLDAKTVDITVNSNGGLRVAAWDFINKRGNQSVLETVTEFNTARTLEDLEAQVDAYVQSKETRILQSADLGLNEDGTFLNTQAAE